MNRGFMLHRLSEGDSEAVKWILEMACIYVSKRGEATFDTCCKLPAAKSARQRALRDYYIAQAAAILGDGVPIAQTALHSAFAGFLAERWPNWKHLRFAPSEASPADRAMFNARKCSDIPDTPQGLGKIVRKVLETA
jgi:hypothetical protein